MKKGFTLTELLAVITLLGLLSLIVVPVVDKLIKDSEEELYQTQIKNIESGAKNWASKNIFSLPENVGESINKTICDLEKEGFIEIDIKNPKTDELFYKDSYVRITKTDYGYEYEYIETGKSFVCTVCEAATDSTLTSGNIPKGNYTPGDEYICEVKEDTKHHFFILSTEEDKINLIMDSNINNEGLAVKGDEDNLGIVGWCDDESKCKDVSGNFTNVNGPIVALEYLSNATHDWITKPRLPYKEELDNLNTGHTEIKTGNVTRYGWNGTNPWLYDNLAQYEFNVESDNISYKSDVNGYWTANKTVDNTECAWNIDYIGFLNTNYIYDHEDSRLDNGVRPVITVYKNEISNQEVGL